MKKIYLIIFLVVLLVFFGWLLFSEKKWTQDMVFRMGTGWTGGMTGYPVFEGDTKKVKQFIGMNMFVNDTDAKEILKQEGGLPSCTVGNPKINVSANVTLTLLKGETATLEPEVGRYYEVKINKLYSVDIDAEECRD
jgi:hypothetical protein